MLTNKSNNGGIYSRAECDYVSSKRGNLGLCTSTGGKILAPTPDRASSMSGLL